MMSHEPPIMPKEHKARLVNHWQEQDKQKS
jgi:hypothetical protein